MKYLLSEPIILGKDIVGYKLIEGNGEIKKAKLEDLNKLASRGLVNAEVLKDSSGKYHVLPQDKLIKDPDNSIYTIECRVIQDGKLKSYKCRDANGNIRNIPIGLAWELAHSRKITGVKAKVVNGKRTLVSDSVNLSKINVTGN